MKSGVFLLHIFQKRRHFVGQGCVITQFFSQADPILSKINELGLQLVCLSIKVMKSMDIGQVAAPEVLA